jgi:hypothetical protein
MRRLLVVTLIVVLIPVAVVAVVNLTSSSTDPNAGMFARRSTCC